MAGAPFDRKKEEGKMGKGKRKKEKGRIRKAASSSISTHGLDSLKRLTQSANKRKKRHFAATIPLPGISVQHHANRRGKKGKRELLK